LKTISKLAIAVLALAFGTAGFAADKRSSVSVFGNISNTKDEGSSANTNATIYGSYGFMLRDSIELEIQVGTNISEFGGGFTSTGFSTGLVGKYYFSPVGEGGALSPYAKAGLRIDVNESKSDDFKTTGTGFGLQVGGGVEYALTESVATFVEATYSRLKFDSDTESDFGDSSFKYDSTVFEINIGLKIRF
jgi:opacity protein-like surface antigen